MRNPRVGAYVVCCLFGLAGGPGPACAEDQAGGVESLNGLKGKVQLAAGSNITVTKTGKKTLTIGGGLTLP
ncbi:MAG: hypothetical protein HYX75_16595 [Acidobacteria bacterium]|nr:hypothetical protein [Acidobacteriota bacterium]